MTQQVHRASWHPSIGVWAGNNEIEGSLGWYSESRTNKQLFAGDYIALFVDTIRNIIKKVRSQGAECAAQCCCACPPLAYWDCTPRQYMQLSC